MRINYLSVKKGTPEKGYWDMALIEDLVKDLPDGDRELFLIPGAYQNDKVDEINKRINFYKKVMVFVTSDEEGNFDCSKLSHPDMILYSEYGTSENVFPLGYTPFTRKILKEIGLNERTLNWFFSGQITHERRKMMAEKLKEIRGGVFMPTGGFAQGIEQKEYLKCFTLAKFAPAPPGPISQDSFRLYEALEAGCVPIVDEYSANFKGTLGYWQRLFPDAPFPVVESWDELLLLKPWTQEYSNKVFAWWIKKKFELKRKLSIELGCPQPEMSVVVPTSPIPSHPSTRIIEKTIKSIRCHTDAPIFITIDGVREEQKDSSQKYNEYIKNLLWKCNFEWENVVPVLFEEHSHQSGMLKVVLPLIKTPLLLYVEHDTPLVVTRKIDWRYLKDTVLSGKANVIRFHYEAFIPEPHRYLMIGEVENDLLKTAQWSQRPHLALTNFYRGILPFFSDRANCFIEDLLYGQLVGAWEVNKMDGWNNWRVYIYHPKGNIQRSLNLDGRRGDTKFEKEQIW